MDFQKTLNFTIEGNSYVINFPTNRQYIAIQNLKAAYASNYAEFQYMGAEPSYAGVLVDAAAHLTILCPQLVENLNKPILDLDLLQGKKLVDCYNDQFRPWYNSTLNFVFGVTKDDKKEGDGAANTGEQDQQ